MNIVYGIYKGDGSLIYIGQTKDMEQRKAIHAKFGSKLRKWMALTGERDVQFRTLGTFDNEDLAKGVEAGIIAAIQPTLNSYCTGDGFRSKYIPRKRRGHSKLRAVA